MVLFHVFYKIILEIFYLAKANIFNSKLMPLKLVFLTKKQSEYTIIFKNGDDIRQDHLVLNVISLINDVNLFFL